MIKLKVRKISIKAMRSSTIKRKMYSAENAKIYKDRI